MTGIWPDPEYRILTRPEILVLRIIAINRQGSDPHLIYLKAVTWINPSRPVPLFPGSLPWDHPTTNLPREHEEEPWGSFLRDVTPRKRDIIDSPEDGGFLVANYTVLKEDPGNDSMATASERNRSKSRDSAYQKSPGVTPEPLGTEKRQLKEEYTFPDYEYSFR
ncbi:hypothetical protein TWF173_004816 [Orbilia oligospora]|nr:hypothetical protein TWF173_004816 [Orbilia oligospora]